MPWVTDKFVCHDHLGKEFSSEREMCSYWNIPYTTYAKRMGLDT